MQLLADLGRRVVRRAGRRKLNEHRSRLEVKIVAAPEPVPVKPVVRARAQHAEAVIGWPHGLAGRLPDIWIRTTSAPAGCRMPRAAQFAHNLMVAEIGVFTS